MLSVNMENYSGEFSDGFALMLSSLLVMKCSKSMLVTIPTTIDFVWTTSLLIPVRENSLRNYDLAHQKMNFIA